MKTLKTLTIVAVTGLVGLTALYACPMGDGEGMHKSMMNNGMMHKKAQMKGMFRQLDLSSEQKTQMKSLRKEMQASRQERMSGKHSRGMEQMGKFVSANSFDKQGFIDMATQKSQGMIMMRANMFEKRMNILTPEQRTKLSELLQEK